MNVMTVKDLNKAFGGVIAVNNLNFSVEKGTIFGIIGPNGAGKTSLFNTLTGFLKPDSGSFKLGDVEVLGRKPYQIVELGVARSFQIVKPFFGMTVRETLELPSHSSRIRNGRKSQAILQKARMDILNRIGLLSKSDNLVDDLNQGELRLLDVARALSTDPEVLFLDEPFSGLGREHIENLSATLLSMRQEGVTIIMVEHRLRELMRLVDRVMAINFGTKLAEGAPEEIVKNQDVIQAYLGTKGEAL